jgi:hypothetical protein
MSTRRSLARIVAGALASGGVAMAAFGLAAGSAQADPDHCSTRTGCYKGPGMRWCPGDYIWPGLRATGWDLSECHVYHLAILDNPNADPNAVAEGPGPPPLPIPTEPRPCPPISFLCP